MSLFDRIVPINPARAIAFRDLPALEDCLAKGWRLVNEGAPVEVRQSRGLVQQLVASGWFPGWQAILRVSPQWRLHRLAVITAFQHLHTPFMVDMLDHGLDIHHPVKAGPPELLPVHLIIEGMGRQRNEPWAENRQGVEPLEIRVQTACALLTRYGLDPYAPYPGEFIPGDSGIAGHSIWTRAVRYGRWEVAEQLLPESWDQVVAQPRALEALANLEQLIHSRVDTHLGDDDGWDPDSDSNPIALDLALEQAQARPLWNRLRERWAEVWFDHLGWHALNTDQDWATWPQEPASVRQAYRRAWARPRSDGLTTYHLLAMDSPTRADARAVLTQLVADGGTPEGWTTLSLDGATPADLLAMTWDLSPEMAADLPTALGLISARA